MWDLSDIILIWIFDASWPFLYFYVFYDLLSLWKIIMYDSMFWIGFWCNGWISRRLNFPRIFRDTNKNECWPASRNGSLQEKWDSGVDLGPKLVHLRRGTLVRYPGCIPFMPILTSYSCSCTLVISLNGCNLPNESLFLSCCSDNLSFSLFHCLQELQSPPNQRWATGVGAKLRGIWAAAGAVFGAGIALSWRSISLWLTN